MITRNVLSKLSRSFSLNLRQIHATLPLEELSVVPHIPVLATETLHHLGLHRDQTIIDMTFGAGGHTKLILKNQPNVRIIAVDRDPTAHEYACNLKKEFPDQIIPILGRFSELPDLLQRNNIEPYSVDGVLFDFGCSSMQFDTGYRGFSISMNGPLDMRMDGNRFPDQPTAADILATIDEDDLARILKIYGEEKNAKKIARMIVSTRHTYKRLETTKELADLVKSCSNEEFRLDKLQRPSHSATKTFQALRIFVNNELNEINYGLMVAQKFLKVNGRLVTITFHSLEDTIVKRHIMGNVIANVANPMPLKYTSHTLLHDRELIESLMTSNWKQTHKHVITPNAEEIESNPRSRSAKLRSAVKIS